MVADMGIFEKPEMSSSVSHIIGNDRVKACEKHGISPDGVIGHSSP